MGARSLRRTLAALVAGAMILLTGTAGAAPPVASLGASAVCGLWYAIGASPSDADITAAAQRYGVVVLNAWDAPAKTRLKALNPNVVVLLYKDFSSTRSYAAPGDLIPAGVDYTLAAQQHPDWFATDTRGARIEWGPYPGHWQMAVWDPGYQRAWTENVTDEAVRDGWDGVFADNDFAHLGYYSSAVLAGTSGTDEGDRKIRDGLDRLVTTAGDSLAAHGKLLVPNVSESRLFPGRWALHSRYGGAMEENFAYWPDEIVDEARGWDQQTASLGETDGISLLVTSSSGARVQRYAFASAAVRSTGRTCWMGATTPDYSRAEWSSLQQIPFGLPTGPPARATSGVWSRSFDGGWMAVNPTGSAEVVNPPAGLRTQDGAPAGPTELAAGDALLLTRR